MSNQVYSNYLYSVNTYRPTPSLSWQFRDNLAISNGVTVQFFLSNKFTKKCSEMYTTTDAVVDGGGLVGADTPSMMALPPANYFAIKVGYSGSTIDVASLQDIPESPSLGNIIKITQDINLTSDEAKTITHAVIDQKDHVLGANVLLFWDGEKWDDLVIFTQTSSPSYMRKTAATLDVEVY